MLKSLRKSKYGKSFYKKLKLGRNRIKNFFVRFKDLIKVSVNKVPKKFLKAGLILILSCLFVVVFVNRENFSPDYMIVFLEDLFAELQHGSGYPYKISGNRLNNENFKIIGEDVFLLSDTTLSVLNNSAKEMYRKQHCYQNPMVKISKTRAIVYDLGGENLELTSKSKSLDTLITGNNIISADISNYGTFAVVTESKGFLGEVTVFAKNGKDIYYKYSFANHYITDVAISEDGKFTSVCGSTAKDGLMVSTVYIFDYKSEEPKVRLDYNDNMFLRVEYLSNGNLVAIGDKLISVINPKNGTKEDYFYDNKNLVAFDVNKKDGVLVALSLSEDGSNSDMIIINKKGKVDKSFHTDHRVKAVSFNRGRLAALSHGQVYVYNFSGKRLKSVNVGNDAKNIRLFSSKGMYVLGITEIRKIIF